MTEKVISYDEVKNHIFIWGELLWFKKSGKVITLANCGECLDHKLLTKLFKNNEEIKIISKLDDVLASGLKRSLTFLREAQFESERVELRDSIISPFLKTMVSGEEQGSLIDWTFTCYESFYELPITLEELYLSKNSQVLERSFIVATVSTLMALTCGYLSFEFLKRIYNTVLVLDVDMIEQGVSNFHLVELEKSRQSRVPLMDSVLLKVHKEHTKGSRELVRQVTKDDLVLEQLVEFHHEVMNCGLGPANIFESDTGDLQKIVNFVERSVPYTKHSYSDGDATSFLRASLDNIEGYERIKRIIEVLMSPPEREVVA